MQILSLIKIILSSNGNTLRNLKSQFTKRVTNKKKFSCLLCLCLPVLTTHQTWTTTATSSTRWRSSRRRAASSPPPSAWTTSWECRPSLNSPAIPSRPGPLPRKAVTLEQHPHRQAQVQDPAVNHPLWTIPHRVPFLMVII